MKKRIGNDIPIVWTLTDTEGNPYDLTGKEFSVCMKLEGMCVYIPMVYTFTENVISFTFYGKDQPGTGIYDLILREGDSEVTYDVQGAVELVPHSWDEDEGDIDIESEIATNGEVNVIEVVKVNGVALPVVDKTVDIAVPTDLADLASDDTHMTVTDAEKAAWNAKYDKPASGIPASDLADGVIPDVSDFVDEDTFDEALEGKQDVIGDLADIRAGAALGATAYQKPSTGIPASDIASGVIPDVSQFITKSVNDLVNYYTKSQTYTKSEVDSLIGAIQGFEYEVVATLPTASAETMYKIYLVPSADPQTQNVKDEYITIDNGASAQTRYTWEQIGSTAIDLSGYVTTSALNTALSNYTTTSDLTTLLAGKQDTLVSGTNIKTVNSTSLLGNGDIDANNVLWCTVNTTTATEIANAITAGKYCLVWSGDTLYALYKETNTQYFFGACDGIYHHEYGVWKDSSVWQYGSRRYELQENRVSSWRSTPDNNHYPSEKLVKDSIDANAVEANPTVPSGTTPTDVKGLKIGNAYYDICAVHLDITNNDIDSAINTAWV